MQSASEPRQAAKSQGSGWSRIAGLATGLLACWAIFGLHGYYTAESPPVFRAEPDGSTSYLFRSFAVTVPPGWRFVPEDGANSRLRQVALFETEAGRWPPARVDLQLDAGPLRGSGDDWERMARSLSAIEFVEENGRLAGQSVPTYRYRVPLRRSGRSMVTQAWELEYPGFRLSAMTVCDSADGTGLAEATGIVESIRLARHQAPYEADR